MFLEFRRIVVSGVQEDKRKVNHYLSLKGGTVSSLQHRSILHYWSMVKVVLYGKQNGDHGFYVIKQVLRRDFLQVFYCERIELAAAIPQIDTPKCRVFEVTVEELHIEIEV